MRRLIWPLAGASLALAACSPALDWREVRPDDSGAVALFPCKPTHHARRVSLAGEERLLHLVACSAGDATWALAYADVGDPAQVGAALDALRGATLDNLGGDAAAARALPLDVAGATPFAASGRLAFAGRRPDGLNVQAQVAVFARGTRAYQATVMGARLPADGLETFFDALATPG